MILWTIRNWWATSQKWKTGLLVPPQHFQCHMWKQLSYAPSPPTPYFKNGQSANVIRQVTNIKVFPGVFLIWPTEEDSTLTLLLSFCLPPWEEEIFDAEKGSQRKQQVYTLSLEEQSGNFEVEYMRTAEVYEGSGWDRMLEILRIEWGF